MSGSVSQTFRDLFDAIGDGFGRLFALLDRWEFWGFVLMFVAFITTYNGLTGFIRERILAGRDAPGDQTYSRADGQARFLAWVLLAGAMFLVALIADAIEGNY